jgi:hypothetical protein
MSTDQIHADLMALAVAIGRIEKKVTKVERLLQLHYKMLLGIGKTEMDARLSVEEFRELEHLVLTQLE